ncbi:MAG: hypothetical protein NTZ48_04225 [Candidatus Omnitrophica bacterium]|nr:hypothetical protein [Candidatus Omnitrophota bacterium]
MEEQADYYGIDVSGDTVEHGSVETARAVQIINERFAALKDKYQSGEEALAATMFGFSKNKDTFIEICINASDSISFKLEFPLPKKLFIFQDIYRIELKLRSREELCSLVKMFFGSPAMVYKDYLIAYKGN